MHSLRPVTFFFGFLHHRAHQCESLQKAEAQLEPVALAPTATDVFASGAPLSRM